MINHPHHGAPVIWQIIKPMPKPIAVRNWRFRATDRTKLFNSIYGRSINSDLLPIPF